MSDMPGIDLGDRNAWDDTTLIDSWNEASKEYEFYHSIAKSGKRLEDVLTEEELKELCEDYGDLIGDAPSAQQPNDSADYQDTDVNHAPANGIDDNAYTEAPQQETPASEQQKTHEASAETPASHGTALDAAMPQAILGTVQDENLKNLMMSWYYAGYYTGLCAGQQQARMDDQAQPKNN